jgi:hypothetical protein
LGTRYPGNWVSQIDMMTRGVVVVPLGLRDLGIWVSQNAVRAGGWW